LIELIQAKFEETPQIFCTRLANWKPSDNARKNTIILLSNNKIVRVKPGESYVSLKQIKQIAINRWERIENEKKVYI
jgi:hypothetical protein